MESLLVKEKSVQVHSDILEERIIDDIISMDLDDLKMLFEFMYPVTVDDVDGEGSRVEEVIITLKEDSGLDSLSDVF